MKMLVSVDSCDVSPSQGSRRRGEATAMKRFRTSMLLLPFQLAYRVLVWACGIAVLVLVTWIVWSACYRIYELLDSTIFSGPWFP